MKDGIKKLESSWATRRHKPHNHTFISFEIPACDGPKPLHTYTSLEADKWRS